MDAPSNGRQRLSFGLFEADLSSGELRKRGHRIHLQDQPFQLLALLLERPGDVVTREEVRTKLWPDGTFVDFDEGLDTALKKLRYALGDSAQNPTFIETIPRRGYRFMLPVTTNNGRAIATADDTGIATRTLRWRFVGAAAAIVVTAAVAAGFFRFYMRPSPRSSPDPKLRQLTISSVQNPVTSGAISPDGKYLAFVDTAGIHIQLVETGEGLTVPLPESLNGSNVNWEILSSAWFPDSARFLVNAHPARRDRGPGSSEANSIWVVSVLGGAPRKLRDNAIAWSVSPDGSLIAFGTKKGRLGDREIWLMKPSGEQAQKLFDTDENSSVGSLRWLQGGQGVIYVTSGTSGDTLVSRDLKAGTLTTLLSPPEMKKIENLSWLSDGRLIYSVREPQVIGNACNYWTTRLDPRTGQTIDKPRRLTNGDRFCMAYMGGTADGKQLAFLRTSVHSATYVAELEAGGTRIRNPRHFTPDDGDDTVSDWTADGRTVILSLNRRDHYSLYKQSLNAHTQEPIVASASGGLIVSAQVSPDDKWVILQIYPIPEDPSAPRPLLRVPMAGGMPEPIFPVPPGSGFTCARPPSSLCILAEPALDRKQMIVTAFDPVQGRRGPELARYDLDPNSKHNHWPPCGISPDGTRLAASPGPEGPIQILSLRGQRTQVIQVPDLRGIRLLGWAGDANGLFVIHGVKDGTVLQHVDLKGHAQVLWKCGGGQQCDFSPSPDGRHLAIVDRQLSANMWIIENF